MFTPMGQTPNYTVSLTQTDTHVFWRGQWLRFAGGDETPPSELTPPVEPTPVVAAPVTPSPAPAVGQTPSAKPFDDAYVRDLRKENAAYRKAAEDAQARLKEIDDAQKSDLEKAQARADAQTAKADALAAELAASKIANQQAIIRTAVEREAHQQGAVKSDVVYRLADLSGVTIDEAGNVTGADKAVKALLEAEPYLKATTQTATTTAIPVTPRATGKPQTQAEMVAAAEARLAQSGRYSRL